PVVRSALRRLTRVHDVDVIACFELAAEDWLRVRVFAAARASGWAPGALAPEGAVFEYRPALGWMRLDAGDRVSGGLESVGELSGRRQRGPRVPLGAPSGWWLRLTPHVLESLADAWDARPQGIRWYADAGAGGLFHTRHAAPRIRVASSGMDWFTVSAEWQAEGLSLRDEDLALLRASRAPFVKLSSGWIRR